MSDEWVRDLSARQRVVYESLASRYGRSTVTALAACGVIGDLYFGGFLADKTSGPIPGGGDQPRPRGEAPLDAPSASNGDGGGVVAATVPPKDAA